MSLLLSKLSAIGPDAAYNYLCDPNNSFGKVKRPNKFPLTVFGPQNIETAKLLSSLRIGRRLSFLDKIILAAEKEKSKEMTPIIAYRLEPPMDGEHVEENPLTWEQFKTNIQP